MYIIQKNKTDNLKDKTRWSRKVIIGLLITILLLLSLYFLGGQEFSDNVNKIVKHDLDKTLFLGEDVLDESKIDISNKLPM